MASLLTDPAFWLAFGIWIVLLLPFLVMAGAAARGDRMSSRVYARTREDNEVRDLERIPYMASWDTRPEDRYRRHP